MKIRTCATFESETFNTTAPKPEFIHPENFGDDVVRWLMEKLHTRGLSVDEDDPSQEDHGWYVTFGLDGALFDLVVSYAPLDSSARWLVAVERSVGLLGSLLGQRRRGVTPNVVRVIDDILQSSPECRNVRWLFFEDVRRGYLEGGSMSPG